ncbi:MAG: hypothetical protein IRZ06_07015 [Nevskia sp.]|nr:hypothetical protein [Nevskia sp.]
MNLPPRSHRERATAPHHIIQEKSMSSKLLSAMLLTTALSAGPVLAQEGTPATPAEPATPAAQAATPAAPASDAAAPKKATKHVKHHATSKKHATKHSKKKTAPAEEAAPSGSN